MSANSNQVYSAPGKPYPNLLNTTLDQANTAQALCTTAGDMFYYDGTQFVRIPVGQSGQRLKAINTVPTWSSPFYANIVYSFGTATPAVIPLTQNVSYDFTGSTPTTSFSQNGFTQSPNGSVKYVGTYTQLFNVNYGFSMRLVTGTNRNIQYTYNVNGTPVYTSYNSFHESINWTEVSFNNIIQLNQNDVLSMSFTNVSSSDDVEIAQGYLIITEV